MKRKRNKKCGSCSVQKCNESKNVCQAKNICGAFGTTDWVGNKVVIISNWSFVTCITTQRSLAAFIITMETECVCVALVALSRFIIHAIAGSIISTGFGFHSFVSRDSLFQRRCDLERTFSMRKSGIVILSRAKATHKFISVNCIAFDLNHAHFTLLIVRLAISYRISYISFICVHKVRTESLFQIDTIFFSRFRR